ncbi:MAG: glycosyltransferase family 4 protein, partial [Deltaproteobacteria bacterium]|nr:glycosyltransferase family 4 protein [Deltaproteobacteria bacterium]
MRILYVSQYFPPEMGAPAARVSELSREWAALGHDVTVLTGFPNHPTGVIPPEYRGELIRRETRPELNGVQVLRVPIHAAANKGLVRRALNYGSFALSSAALGPVLAKRPQVLIATSPQILTAVSGAWLATVLRVPFVLEVRDLWPKSIVAVGALKEGSLPVRALELVEKGLYKRADRIVSVTDSFV